MRARLGHRVLVFSLFGVAACGPGGAYDDLSGGTKAPPPATEDAALVAPRPMSPISVSMVATSRPRVKWALGGAATGAVVEMSKTRTFTGDVKRFEASGSELVVPEDLEPGIWFWRLEARTETAVGTVPSATWEVLVRGPAAHGVSDVPTGAIVDYDGDGIPDLLTVADLAALDPTLPPDAIYAQLVTLRGLPGGMLQPDGRPAPPIGFPSSTSQAVTIAGGTDLDGDGFADVALGDVDPDYGGGEVYFEFGGASALDPARELPMHAQFFALPGLHEAGDTNGDGYGDLFAGDAISNLLTFGGPKGPAAFVPAFGAPGGPDSSIPMPAMVAAFDANGDGLTDVAIAPTLPQGRGSARGELRLQPSYAATTPAPPSDPRDAPFPMIAAAGSTDMQLDTAHPMLVRDRVEAYYAAAFASGDFDGDGLSDIAATVVDGGVRQVCFWYGDTVRFLRAGGCASAPTNDASFGVSLTAADLEGDGIDELLVAGSAAIYVARANGTSVSLGEPMAGYGNVVTTIWPGRPGRARWATVTGEGTMVAVFEGTRVLQSLPRPNGAMKAGFGRVLR